MLIRYQRYETPVQHFPGLQMRYINSQHFNPVPSLYAI